MSSKQNSEGRGTNEDRIPQARSADAPATHDSARSVCQRFHLAVELIGRRWTGAILQVLLQGPARFSVIGASLPAITDRMLSERLRELEAEGLVARTVVPAVPVRVEYALTDKGRDLTPALEELGAWAHRWLAVPEGADEGHPA